ncbi:MAG: HprK-related kinase B [gamma proteobacterium symbiont of Bathyaustriella thionipta]|nr:HprK-related kinase B [gamma proteobacterium symbiont of Bathyaustriella thionipta]MCU7950684.1 HprK-related kinase B [gamma proteobacterium symbiont of Bathyaustriella thionipta]MCU7952602.1 HprK-related kinase B [gamma proteobacterium symbiont of Bathyaustriella thionipta]MCU7957182.1 HprK-related kinase B [gamma proteobacterium symbiont of Bathyaustriella thionipta]MCU7968061.1 HprK-related kinase B [gamma proteobacterium symbiont of Bathyaustriella thionipta]
MVHTIESISQQLIQEKQLVSERLHLKINDWRLELRSNSKELIDKLSRYFSNCNVIGDENTADITMIAIECKAPELGINFIDWKREPGKTGRKDEYFDLKDARVVRKVRTGMVFLQSEKTIIAAGPCIQNDNQVINFINSQYMNWLQQHGWLICHASGLVHNNNGLAIAGFSGGGKSTLMLEFMNDSSISFMTNDRLFIKSSNSPSNQTQMSGIPKLPRINPGTIVGNPVLHSLMSPDELAHYQTMEKEQLWDIEEKYDVSIKQVYGDQRLQNDSPLFAFLILNWQRDSNKPVTLSEVNLEKHRDLLKAIMKPSGPFYQDTDAKFQTDKIQFDEDAYLSMLSGVKIYEAHGGINFKQLTELCKTALM